MTTQKEKKLLTCAVSAFFKVYYLPKSLHDPPPLTLLHPMCRDCTAEMGSNWDTADSSAFMLTGGSTQKMKNPFDTVGVPRVQAQ